MDQDRINHVCTMNLAQFYACLLLLLLFFFKRLFLYDL